MTVTEMTISGRSSAGSGDQALLKKSWKTPVVLAVFAVLGVVLLVIFGRGGNATLNFTATSQPDAIKLAEWVLPARVTNDIVAVVALLMAAGSFLYRRASRRIPLWYISVFAVVLVFGFLVWSATDTGHVLFVTSLLVGGLALSAPIIFGGLGGVISERVGVTNVAIEGQLLSGAFVSAVAASITQSVVVGIIAAAVAGVLVSFVLGAFAIKYAVNQVIVGIVLNVLVLGLTTFLYQTVLLTNIGALNSPPQLHVINIPLLSRIPVIGPLLFSQTIIVYLMYVAVIAVFFGLFRTRWGLRLRSVGEHPQAADTVGINVGRTRFWNVALAGGIVGIGGAYFTLGSVGPFSQNMTNGLGYIALAAVIFGRWDPVRVTLAALLFGFASNLQSVLGILGSPVPNDFLLMLPYLVTIFAVAGLGGAARAPAAAGRPYIKS
ncbi:MAG TPA: ABC transporter permease [Galbitalea sp.]